MHCNICPEERWYYNCNNCNIPTKSCVWSIPCVSRCLASKSLKSAPTAVGNRSLDWWWSELQLGGWEQDNCTFSFGRTCPLHWATGIIPRHLTQCWARTHDDVTGPGRSGTQIKTKTGTHFRLHILQKGKFRILEVHFLLTTLQQLARSFLFYVYYIRIVVRIGKPNYFFVLWIKTFIIVFMGSMFRDATVNFRSHKWKK